MRQPTPDEKELIISRLSDQAATVLAPIFGLFRWEWALAKYGIPTHAELEQHVDRHLCDLLENEGWFSTGSGRIRCERKEDGTLAVLLEITEAFDLSEDFPARGTQNTPPTTPRRSSPTA